jgi:aminoglycoside 2''-phosphotransferase
MVVDHRWDERDAIKFEIARVAPRFAVAPVVPLGEGMDSLAVLVGDALVFRFAKHPEAAMGLKREIALLPRLASRLNLDIPRFEYVGENSVTGLPFVGYGLIRGEPLHRPLYDRLTRENQERVLDDLSAFLNAVHAFSVHEAIDCGVAPDRGRTDHIDDLQRARKDVFPRLHDRARFDLESRLGAFLEDDRNFVYAPTLLHGDLWPEHVLFAPAVGRLAGVIDFGDVSIGDLDYDLAFLAQRLGPSFIERLLTRYKRDDHTRLSEKIRCFNLLNTISDVFIGLDRGDQALVNSAIAELLEQPLV